MSIYLDEDEDEDKDKAKPADIEIDIDVDRLVASEPPPVRRIDLRPILRGLVILMLGGGLGTAAYFAFNLDMRDVIGVLDVADERPRLSMQMPGRGGSAVEPPPAPPSAPAPAAAPDSPAAPGMLAPPSAPAAAPTPPPATEPAPAAAAAPALPSPPPQAVGPAVPALPGVREPAPPPSFTGLPAIADVTPLGPVPVDLLFRTTPAGPLPIIALDGRQPWKVYAAPFDAPPDRARLAVVITNLGLEREPTEAAITRLPPQVTLSFSPYANGLDKWVKQARQAGHEVLIGLPTEPSGFPDVDPGPLGLLTSLDADENLMRLEKVLVRLPGHVGVLASDGPFVRSKTHLAPILDALKERGLMYVGRVTDAAEPPAHAEVAEVLDQDLFREAIDARFERAVAAAKAKGRVLVVASARPVTLDRLSRLLPKLQGVSLAPASAVAVPPPAPGGKS